MKPRSTTMLEHLRLRRHEILALVLASAAAPAGYCLGSFARAVRYSLAAPGAGPVNFELRGVMVVFAVGMPIALLASVLAVPAYLLLRVPTMASPSGHRLPRLRALGMVVVGAAVGTLVAVLLTPHLGKDLISVPMPWWSGTLMGASSAAVFAWMVNRSGT